MPLVIEIQQLSIYAILSNSIFRTEEEKEYLQECINKTEEGEFDYTAYAYRENVGRFEDCEYVPFCKDIPFWLKAIFDGFEALCTLLKKQEETAEMI